VSGGTSDPSDFETKVSDPLAASCAVPVRGGRLTVAHTGPAPDCADVVVLAIHGITSNLLAWRAVAREINPEARVSVLAPDLRGRGRSTTLPAPYGFGAHVADMLAVLDHLGVPRAVLVGHSMGAYLAARIAADRPERVASLVLVDGGVPVGELTDEAAAAANVLTVGPAIARQALTFASDEAYLDFWRLHPAFVNAWNEDVEAYALHDLRGVPGARTFEINVDAVEADSDQMLRDPRTRNALDYSGAHVRVLRAARGSLDDDNPLIPQPALDRFVAENPEADVELVADVNHYTLLLGEGPGPARVAAAIDAAARAAAGG
jgi:lipase